MYMQQAHTNNQAQRCSQLNKNPGIYSAIWQETLILMQNLRLWKNFRLIISLIIFFWSPALAACKQHNTDQDSCTFQDHVCCKVYQMQYDIRDLFQTVLGFNNSSSFLYYVSLTHIKQSIICVCREDVQRSKLFSILFRFT